MPQVNCTLVPLGGLFASLGDLYTARAVWKGGDGSSSLEDDAYHQNVYWEAFGVMAAAITQAPSLNATGLRAGVLSLQGQSDILLQIDIDPATGIQAGYKNPVVQVNRDGVAVTDGPMEYPFDWPWHPLAYGDDVSASFEAAIDPLVLVVAVVGAWVGSIVIEQAVYAKRMGGRWHLWLMVAATSLGGIGLWCSMLLLVAGVTVSGDGRTFDLTFSLGAAFVGLVPALVLTYAGLCVLIGDTQTQVCKQVSGLAAQQQALREQKEVQKRRAALNWREHLHHLYRSISVRAVVGGLLVASALPATGAALNCMWVTEATQSLAAGAWVVMGVLNVLLVLPCMLIAFHGLRRREAGPFLFAVLLLVDWAVQRTFQRWTYSPVGAGLPASFPSTAVDRVTVQLLAGVLAAATSLLFVGVQFRSADEAHCSLHSPAARRLTRSLVVVGVLSALCVQSDAAVAQQLDDTGCQPRAPQSRTDREGGAVPPPAGHAQPHAGLHRTQHSTAHRLRRRAVRRVHLRQLRGRLRHGLENRARVGS